MDRTVGMYYHIKRKLGAGSFGKIYLVEHTVTHELYAAKFESADCPAPQLQYEAKLYRKFAGGSHVPSIHWTGCEKNHNIMVMDLLGSSLEELFQKNGQKLSLKTVLILADQMLSAIQYIHSKNYIHRDIKPDNFMVGTGKNAVKVFSIDFGLSKRYRDDYTHEHIRYIEGKSLTGTARYASIGALRGHEQSRRDDLEALGYVWIYLLKGKLPWMGLNAHSREEKYRLIADCKEDTPLSVLCLNLPSEFIQYMTYVRNLGFTESPNYSKLRELFRSAFRKAGFVNDQQFEWTEPKSTFLKEKPAPQPVIKQNFDYRPTATQLKAFDSIIRDKAKSPRNKIEENYTPREEQKTARNDGVEKKRNFLYNPQKASNIRAQGAREYAYPSRLSKIPRRFLD